MAIYALIKKGICVNTIVCEPEVVNTIQFDADAVIPITEGGIGDLYDDKTGEFTRPPKPPKEESL